MNTTSVVAITDTYGSWKYCATNNLPKQKSAVMVINPSVPLQMASSTYAETASPVPRSSAVNQQPALGSMGTIHRRAAVAAQLSSTAAASDGLSTRHNSTNIQGVSGNNTFALANNNSSAAAVAAWKEDLAVEEVPSENLRFIEKLGEGQFGEVNNDFPVGIAV